MMSELVVKDEHQSDEAGRLLLPVWGSGPGPWPQPAIFEFSWPPVVLEDIPGGTQTQVQILARSFTVYSPP